MDSRSPQKDEHSVEAARRNTGPTPAKVRELPTPPSIKGGKAKMPPPADTGEDTEMTEGDPTQGDHQNTRDKPEETASQT